MATLLVGDYTRIDFLHPIEMTETQFKLLVDGLKEIFDKETVKVEETQEFRGTGRRLGDYFPRESFEDYEFELLLAPISTEQKSKKLGRTFMSIRMKECEWLPKYNRWYGKNGNKNLTQIENIRKFLMEQKIEKAKKSKVKIYVCRSCFTYHDPRNREWDNCSCYVCGERKLRLERVSWNERQTLYSEQPNSKYPSEAKELLKKYPPLDDNTI